MFRAFLAAAALGSLPVAAADDRDWSAYAQATTITASGVLTNVTWGKPYVTAGMMIDSRPWTLVLGPTSRLEARGVKAAAINKGQTVTVMGSPRRDGAPELRIEWITVGKTTVEMR
jgi:hypothetical protein